MQFRSSLNMIFLIRIRAIRFPTVQYRTQGSKLYGRYSALFMRYPTAGRDGRYLVIFNRVAGKGMQLQTPALKGQDLPSLMALSRSDLTSSLGFSGMTVLRSWGGPEEMLFSTAFIGEF